MGTGLDNSSLQLPKHQIGIVPRAIELLFDLLNSKEGDAFEFAVYVSFLELYNEELVDLLNPMPHSHSRPNTAGSSRPATAANHLPNIREDANGNIIWSNVREEPVSNPQELLSCLQRGSLCRSTGSTDMNAASSRSHAIFSIILKQREKVSSSDANPPPSVEDPSSSTNQTPPTSTKPLPQTYRTTLSKFHFVDLAGSERLKRTNAEGDRKKEGISINQGLLALGNCISALGDESRSLGPSSRSLHVPYRDSKLTRMLQDSLGGNSTTLMIACVSPSETSVGETVSTLQYANRARNIKNKVAVVQEFTGAGTVSAAAEREICSLRALVADLREEIVGLRGGVSNNGGASLGGGSGNAGIQGTATSKAHSVAAHHERDFQLSLQDSRDLENALAESRLETQVARFEADRFAFKCCRLLDRVNDLTEEVSTTKKERDLAIVELEQWRSGKLRVYEQQIQASTSTPTPSTVDHQKVLDEYTSTITDLRLKLSETSDQLAWYHEALNSVGKDEERRDRIMQTFRSIPGNSTNDVPSPRSIRVVKKESEVPVFEVAHEGRLLKALKTDPEVGQALSPTEPIEESSTEASEPQPRLFGLPKTSTATTHSSHLTHETTNDTDTDMDEDDDNDDQDSHYSDLDETTPNSNPSSTATTSTTAPPKDKSQEIYLLIHRLQTDIKQHEALLSKHAKRDQEYQAFREAYESKLSVLQAQLSSVGRERDEAIKKMKSGGGAGKNGGGERPGTAAVKLR
ncbi:hypothetical protein HDU99_002076, partial [Rhizoclosmatium hyalinum]